MGALITILFWIGVVGLVLVTIAWAWTKFKGTSAASALPDSIETFLNTLTNATVKATDVSGVVSSYIALTGIRKLDCVEADPKAIEAADYLRGVITAWKRPAETVAVVTVTPTIETLAAEVASLKAQVTVTPVSTTAVTGA